MKSRIMLNIVLLTILLGGCLSADKNTIVLDSPRKVNSPDVLEANKSDENSILQKNNTIKQVNNIQEIKDKTNGKIILVTLTEACKCTLQRCNETGAKIREMVGSFPGKIELNVVYYNLDKENANSILEKYGNGSMPVVILLDNNDKLIYKSDFSIDYAGLQEALDGLTKE